MKIIEEIFKAVESVPDFYEHKINSVNYCNGHGDSPLHIVSCWGDCEAISALLLNGANINAKGESGFTPLHCATEQNHPEAVKLLLQNGALIQVENSGITPLELAELLGHQEISAILKSNLL